MFKNVVVVNRTDLEQGLKDVLPVVNKSAYVDALKNVHLTVEGGRLAVRGTNLSTSVKTWVPVEQAPAVMEICAPAHLLQELVSLLPAESLHLDTTGELVGTLFDDRTLAVSCRHQSENGSRFDNRSRLRGCAVADFPLFTVPAGEPVEVPAAILLGVIRQVKHFVDRDGAVPVLGGLLFRVKDGQLTVAATNRKCLAVAVEPLDLPDLEVVIEVEALNILARHLTGVETVQVAMDEVRVLFRLPNLELTGQLLGQSYPDYERILPTRTGTQATAKLPELLAGVEGALRFGRHGNKQVVVEISGNGDGRGRIEVTVDDVLHGSYRAGVGAVVAGEPVRLTFFSDQLVQGLRALKAADVAVEVVDGEAMAPVVFRGGNSKQVIMPLAV